jgi:catechol 2,3-dioxygenase-like lactoylglutathione lyase family enzyme
MLKNYPIQATLPAVDLERARQFYSEKLGLTPESELPGGLTYRCGEGTGFLLFPSLGQASGTHTQVSWAVDNLEAEMAELRGRGIVFEEYDTPNLKTINGVATMGEDKVAWFKDSEGNLHGMGQLSFMS